DGTIVELGRAFGEGAELPAVVRAHAALWVIRGAGSEASRPDGRPIRLASPALRSLLFASCVVLLVGCPSSDPARKSTDAQASQPCLRVGQTCEYAPNKLGSCVQRDNCTQDCLVCQSQH